MAVEEDEAMMAKGDRTWKKEGVYSIEPVELDPDQMAKGDKDWKK
jgi:hypothetical protein